MDDDAEHFEAEAADVPEGLDLALREQLDKLQNPQHTLGKSLMLLFVSVAVFISLGLVGNSVFDVAVLVGVLLFHEAGHFVGMKMFGYRNVRMFFIPLFGAAVSGRRTSVEAYKEAIVTLLGPLPGLGVGFVLFAVYAVGQNPIVYNVALMFTLINAFNLLPIMPLDGGRLLHLLLFSRHHLIETIVSAVAAVSLMLFGFSISGWLLMILGLFMLLGVGNQYRCARLARDFRREFPGLAELPDPELPEPVARLMLDRLPANLIGKLQPAAKAQLLLGVWDKIRVRRTGWLATLALLLVYGGSIVAAIVVPAVLLILAGALENPAGN